MDRFAAMTTFSKVVEMGSFARAADRLDVSVSSVSRQIAELELHLGTRLLNRTTRRLSLTESGRAFHQRTVQLLADLTEAEESATAETVRPRGTLRMTVPITFGVRYLAPAVAEFVERFPDMRFDVELSDRAVDLVDEGFDLALRIARLPDSSLVSRKIASTRLVLCASPAYLKRRGKPKHPADLAAHDVLGYSLLAMKDQWQFEGPEGPVTVKISPRFWTNNGDTSVAAAVRGAGIVLQPTFLIADELASGRLVELLPAYRSLELGIYAIYPSRKFVLPKVRALVEFLSDAFADAVWMGPK